MMIYQDASRLPELKNTICALADFVQAIDPPAKGEGDPFRLKGRRWVYTRHFVTFEIQSKRNSQVVMTLDGQPFEFRSRRKLPLKPSRTGYSTATIEHPEQLAAAASYIEQSLRLCMKGRRRERVAADV